MKLLRFYTILSLNIVMLFAMAIAYSFLTDYLQNSGFFADVKLAIERKHDAVDKWYDWGTRHYLWFWMSVLLFLAQLARTVHFIASKANKEFN